MDKENWTKWFPFKVTSYRADTAHLSLAQHGAYTLLLGEQWLKGGIKSDGKAIQRVLMGRQMTDGVQDVLNDFFVLKDGFYKNPHLEAERKKAEDKYSSRVENGKKNIKKRWGGKPTLVDQTTSQEEIERNEGKKHQWKLSEYVFRGEVIRLKSAEFKQWKQLYLHIDLVQELKRIDIELQQNKDNPKWFVTVSHKLNYANKLAEKGKLPNKPQLKGAI